MKFTSLTLLFLFVLAISIPAQKHSDPVADKLYQNYYKFEEKSIEDRRFKHEDIRPLITELNAHPDFTTRQVGSSVEGRPLYLITIGEGETDIFFWSQMHGNEPTATAAIFDVFNFLKDHGDEFSDLKNEILSNTTLHFLPMVNPDGAEQFERRNALDIDINRDALRLTSAESVALKAVRDSLNPDFGFNLHDQSTYYTSGREPDPATVSFLAPAYDFEQSENRVRRNAMKQIVHLNEILQTFIPGQVAKYSDAHEPRAFGDMMQKWGTSTILIESGGFKDDPEKQFIRKLNFIMLIASAHSIGQEIYAQKSTDDYYKIPENELLLYNLIIRNVEIEKEDQLFQVDLGIRHNEQDTEDHRSFTYRSSISEVGDLSTYYGYREIDGEGLKAEPGKVYEDTLSEAGKLQDLNVSNLLKLGYTDVVVDAGDLSGEEEKVVEQFPLNVVLGNAEDHKIELGAVPNFVLSDNQQVHYVIVNGFVYDAEKDNPGTIQNGLIYR